jgi:hypothetical protein
MRQSRQAVVVLRARALFVSTLPTHSAPSPVERDLAVHDAVRSHGGLSGCLAEVAFAFGDHPETAGTRMRWAREVAE